jgi:hypothetical protein
VPEPRQCAPRTDDEVVDLAAGLKMENPARTAAQVRRILAARLGPAEVPSERAIQRWLAARELNTRPGGQPPEALVWISPGNPHPVSRYQDLSWSLAPLIDNPGVRLWRISWKDCPGQLRGPMRQAAWPMINGELRPTYLQTRGSGARARSSATTISDTCREWMRLARWLHDRGVISLAACTADQWRDYAAGRVKDGVSRGVISRE